MLSDCPASLRQQRRATLRLAKAFRADDHAKAFSAAAGAELDEAFGKWAANKTISREEARTLLELAGMIEKRTL